MGFTIEVKHLMKC